MDFAIIERHIWSQVVDVSNIEYQPAIMIIGADSDDIRKMVNEELVKKMEGKGYSGGWDKIEVQTRGFRFPAAFKEYRRKMAVIVMVHTKDLNQTVDVLMKLQNDGR